ncbi:hypothetical protein ZEAMMB73_Zm00001d035253 [Zea mays]|uniref:Uncharacterized protein n=1 Tax=Zea mays TaxID=4577 RepID=A0A1D6LF51_MAIZE|nr:hypothetical protein ZEAMMB73_Zm00001d035253 [Zea mays]
MRAVNMMKNNQLFQRLGLGQLKTMITATTTNNNQGGPQESGSLYDGENVEDSGEEDVGMEFQARKGVPTHISNDGEHMSTKVTRGNKRIMAPVQERPVRVTRQRVAEESCVKNKLNREKVQYQQCTGSQSYIAKAFILVRK